MMKPTSHKNEKQRLDALASYSILDSLSESDYDDLTTIASEICHTPISLVSLLDGSRQWFKSHHGLSISETPKDFAFCAHAINESDDVFIVQDARNDIRFHDNPLVTGEPHVAFYAGVVLKTADDLPLGTLCVIDSKPNHLSQSQINSLKTLAAQVMNLLELRKSKILLERANEELKENNRELERFAFIAAHDLAAPLHNISSLLNLLSENYKATIVPEAQEILELIARSGEKLQRMIGGLLDYSRTVKLIREDRTQVDLELLKADMIGLYSFENKCQISLTSKLTSIYVNRTAIEQILLNLIANANKYCDKDVAVITIDVQENEKQYEITLSDNGPGIKKEHQAKVFSMFETLSTTDRFGNSGNGIGLAIVKKLVENMGGEIRVEGISRNLSKKSEKRDICRSINTE